MPCSHTEKSILDTFGSFKDSILIKNCFASPYSSGLIEQEKCAVAHSNATWIIRHWNFPRLFSAFSLFLNRAAHLYVSINIIDSFKSVFSQKILEENRVRRWNQNWKSVNNGTFRFSARARPISVFVSRSYTFFSSVRFTFVSCKSRRAIVSVQLDEGVGIETEKRFDFHDLHPVTDRLWNGIRCVHLSRSTSQCILYAWLLEKFLIFLFKDAHFYKLFIVCTCNFSLMFQQWIILLLKINWNNLYLLTNRFHNFLIDSNLYNSHCFWW